MIKTACIYPAGENALTVCLGNKMDIAINDRVFRLFRHLHSYSKPFWKDLIPAYCTLTIVYDAVAIRKHHPAAFDWVKNEMEQALHECMESETLPVRKLEIPVCYDPAFGLDLKSLAKTNNLSVDQVIELHTQQSYRVYMLGFLPGFAYMGMVDEKIATPRLSTPRKHVPAGSVGIAGNQTGIYPLVSPGGWNIIGRTPVKLFDSHAKHPVLFQPGDEVSFYSIRKEAFDAFDVKNFNPFGR